jgi:hypothetical protein
MTSTRFSPTLTSSELDIARCWACTPFDGHGAAINEEQFCSRNVQEAPFSIHLIILEDLMLQDQDVGVGEPESVRALAESLARRREDGYTVAAYRGLATWIKGTAALASS